MASNFLNSMAQQSKQRMEQAEAALQPKVNTPITPSGGGGRVSAFLAQQARESADRETMRLQGIGSMAQSTPSPTPIPLPTTKAGWDAVLPTQVPTVSIPENRTPTAVKPRMLPKVETPAAGQEAESPARLTLFGKAALAAGGQTAPEVAMRDSGEAAMAMGFDRGVGAAGVRALLGAREDVSDLAKEHPVAFNVGAGAGSLAQVLGVGKVVSGAKMVKALPVAGREIARSAVAMGTNAGLNKMAETGDYGEAAKAGALGGAAGAVGGAASAGVGALGTKALFATGTQNSILANIFRSALSGGAFTGASGVTRATLDEDYNPTKEELVKDVMVGALFAGISSAVSACGASKVDRARLEQDVNALKADYLKIINGAGASGSNLETLEDLAARTAGMRQTINTTAYVGQQKSVDAILEFLDRVDDVVAQAKTAVYGTMLPGSTAGAAGQSTSGMVPTVPTVGAQTQRVESPFALGTVQNMAQRVREAQSGAEMDTTITQPAAGAEGAEGQKTASTGEAGKADRESYTVIAKLQENLPGLSKMSPVAVTSTKGIQPVNGQTMASRARALFESIKGIVTRQGFGDVEIDTRSVKDDLSHGVGPAKAAVIPSIPKIIAEGTQIDFQENWKGRAYDGYIFAAPVTMDRQTVYVAAVVKRTSKNRFYLHEVVDSNGNIIKIGNSEGATQTSLAAESDAGTPSLLPTDTIIPEMGDGVKAEYARQGRDDTETEPVKISLEEYLGQRGLSSPISDYMDDKLRLPHGETARGQKIRQAEAQAAAQDYARRREAAIQEYNAKVESGEIIAPSTVEKLLRRARGHEDNPSTQAARRALEKRGIEWRQTSGPDQSQIIQPVKQRKIPKPFVLGRAEDMARQAAEQRSMLTEEDWASLYESEGRTRGQGQEAKSQTIGEKENPFIDLGKSKEPVDVLTPEEQRMVAEAKAIRARRAKQAKSGEPQYYMTPAMEKLGMEPVSKAITDMGAAISLRGEAKALHEAKKALDEVLKDTFADEGARKVAELIRDGIMTYEQAQAAGYDSRSMHDIVDAMQLVKSFNAKNIKAHQERTNWGVDGMIIKLIKGADKWTPPSVTSLNINTMQRNVERMVGTKTPEGAAQAKAINGEFFDPVIENEAKRIRWVNRTLAKIETYHLNSEESALVQQLMEGKLTEGDLKGKGHDVERLSQAAKTLTELYADFYEAINDFLVCHGYKEIGWQKNYAPHMQEENVSQLEKYLQRLGFQVGVTELPTELAGRTDAFKPGKQYNPYFQHRTGGEGDIKFDAVGGLESYINYLSNVLYHTDDIQKLRRLSEGIRLKFSDELMRGEIDRLRDLQDRIVRGDLDDLTMDDLQAKKEKIFERFDQKSKLGGFVSVLDDYTNILAGKQAKLDRAVESMFGRKALNFGRNIQNAFARSAVVGNLSSAINQTVQLPQLTTEVGPKFVLEAIKDVLSGTTGKSQFDQESTFLTGKQGIHTISELHGLDMVRDKLSVPFELVDDLASRIIVRSKYLQQVSQGADHATALKAADEYANRLVGSRMKGAKPVFFEQKNPVSKLVSTFQLEVANGFEHIIHDLPMEIQETYRTQGKEAAVGRTVGLVVAGSIAAFLGNLLIKSITGQEPVPFDGVGMAINFMASGYGMSKEEYMAALGGDKPDGAFDLGSALKAAGEDVLEDLPLVSNVTTLLGITDGRLPLPQLTNANLKKAGKDAMTLLSPGKDETEREEAKGRILGETALGLGELGLGFVTGGNQIKKTVKALPLLTKGGAYSGSGENAKLIYPVKQSAANWARGLAFGKSALPETNTYYATGARALTVDQTQLYQGLVDKGEDSQTAYDLIQALRGEKDPGAKVDIILGYEGTEESKMALFQGMVTESLNGSLHQLQRMGVSIDLVMEIYKAEQGVKGDGTNLSASRNKKAVIDRLTPGLPKAQTEALYAAFGVSEKVWSEPKGLPVPTK